MTSPTKASGSKSAPEKDEAAPGCTRTQQTESKKHQTKSKSKSKSKSEDSQPETGTTKEPDKAAMAFNELEQLAGAGFSQLIEALTQYKIAEPVATKQPEEPPASAPAPRDHFAENMREEALIIDKLAGPNATPAQRQAIEDDAAAARLRLAEQSMESVAESMARDKAERDARRARRRAAVMALRRAAALEARREVEERERELVETVQAFERVRAHAREAPPPGADDG